MSITIRPFQPENPSDIEAITEIYAYHVTHGSGSFEHEPPSRQEMTQRLEALVAKSYPILLAVEEGAVEKEAVLGYAYAGPHKARKGYDSTVEDSVYVAPQAHRRGIGRQLLTALITAAEAAGYLQMMAVIGDSENVASIGLHADLGFTLIGTAKGIGFKFGRYLDVTYMQKALHE